MCGSVLKSDVITSGMADVEGTTTDSRVSPQHSCSLRSCHHLAGGLYVDSVAAVHLEQHLALRPTFRCMNGAQDG